MKTSIFLSFSFVALTSACSEAREAEPAKESPPMTAKIVAPSQPTAPQTPPDVAAAPADAKRSASGLAWKVLQPGTGKRHPVATDMVEVHYSGWTTDGRMFDSSVARGQPASFPLNGVIRGWTEGVQLMVEGEKTRFWIPAELAYGNNPMGGRPAGLLVFDVELLRIR